jgi:hypothetical protein
MTLELAWGYVCLFIMVGPIIFMVGAIAHNFYRDCQDEEHMRIERELTRLRANEEREIHITAKEPHWLDYY